MSSIGKTIKYIREQRGLTQKQLAEMAGITNVAISDWENGNNFPKFNSLLKLAKAFNMEADQLLNYKIGNDIPESSIESVFIGNEEIIEWLKRKESIPFVTFAYELSKEIPATLLDKLKFFIDMKEVK